MGNILKRYSRFFSPVNRSPRVLQYDRLPLNVQYKSGPLITLHIVAELRVILRQLSLGSCSPPSASWEVDKTFIVPKRKGNSLLWALMLIQKSDWQCCSPQETWYNRPSQLHFCSCLLAMDGLVQQLKTRVPCSRHAWSKLIQGGNNTNREFS